MQRTISQLTLKNESESLRNFKCHLQNEIVNQQSEEKNYLYSERIKEQELLYNLFNILNGSKYLRNTLQAVVEIIPYGTQYPEEIKARLVFENELFYSVDFSESATYLSSTFQTYNFKKGKIEVFYQPNRNLGNIKPSFKEAKNLIECIALLLQGWLNKHETENHLQNMLAHLESKIEERTAELKVANEALSQINRDIEDSINYADNIQRAVLPATETIKNLFNDAFVFYKPKNIVSGDFFWIHQSGERIFYVCGDCTGHGVPGALMSMIGNQLLDHIITDKKISEPELILKEMDEAVTKLLKKEMASDYLRDGMALSLFVIDKSTQKVSFAGACNNSYMISGDEMFTFTADRLYIGGIEVAGGKNFLRTELNYKSGDQLYMFTDGFADQIGGPKQKKIMRKKLLALIFEIRELNHDEQKSIIEAFFNDWKTDNFQIDDVTLLGFKL